MVLRTIAKVTAGGGWQQGQQKGHIGGCLCQHPCLIRETTEWKETGTSRGIKQPDNFARWPQSQAIV